MFIGRKKELQLLNEKIISNKFEFGIIYGRRRIGKTRLIKEVLKDKKGIYFVASEMDYNHNVLTLSNTISNFYNEQFSFSSIEDIFQYLKLKSIIERVVLVIDEFTYLLNSNPSIQSLLQNIIDSSKDTNMCLILSGSHIGMMEDILTYKRPLYGRITFKLKLDAFDYYDSSLFYPNFTNKEKVILYSIFGGIPYYLSLIDNKKSVKANIIDLLISDSAILRDEIDFIIRQELRSISTYKMILDAISSGATRLNDISNKANINNTGNTATYLNTLINLELVKREIPFGDNENSKRSIYKIKDNLINFTNTFINKNKSSLTILPKEVFYEKIIEEHLNEYVSFIFEDLCIEFLIRRNKTRETDLFYNVGKYWGNNPSLKLEVELDVLTEDEEGITVYECKWTKNKFSSTELNILKTHSSHLQPKKYGGFSYSGFTEEVKVSLDYFYTLDDLFKV